MRQKYIFHLESPQTMGNFPCNTENRLNRNNSAESNNHSLPSSSCFSGSPESVNTSKDFENRRSSIELLSSNQSKPHHSNSTTFLNITQQEPENHRNIHVHEMASAHLDSTCHQALIRESQTDATESSFMNSDEPESTAKGNKETICPHLSRELLDIGHYPILHAQHLLTNDAIIRSAIDIRNTVDCGTSNTPQKEWVPFYSSYFACPHQMGNTIRWTPYSHSFETMKSNGDNHGNYSFPGHPTDMMQSLPIPIPRDRIDSLDSGEKHFHSMINDRLELVKNENQHRCPYQQQFQIQQHVDWMQRNMLMSMEPSVMNTSTVSMAPPFWRYAIPTNSKLKMQENDMSVKIDEFMSSYILRSLSPSKGIRRDESPTKPTKRSHESSDETHRQTTSSPLRMYVRSNQDEDLVKDSIKGQRIFSRQRRGRQAGCSRYNGSSRDERCRSNDVKKSRSTEQPKSYPSNVPTLNVEEKMIASRESSPPPAIRSICGKRVVMVDLERKVFIIDLLSSDDCDNIRKMTDDYVRGVYESHSGAMTWRTLYTYTKQDLPCGEVPGLTARFTNRIMAEVIKIVGEIYSQPKEAAKLRPRSWKEPHLLLYQRIENKPVHTGVEMHYDGCDITWNCMLSKPSEYEGGGTYIRCLKKTIMLNQGQVLVHPGELYHKGVDITKGTRSLIVCFMDGFNPKMTDDSHTRDDKAIYELNVRRY